MTNLPPDSQARITQYVTTHRDDAVTLVAYFAGLAEYAPDLALFAIGEFNRLKERSDG